MKREGLMAAIGDGLAFPWGNIGQWDGAVSAGFCDASGFDFDGSVDDMAQWCTP
jgi:hypothetical protein